MTPEALAALHAAAFERPRPWSAAEFSQLQAGPGAFLLVQGGAFVLGRALAGEAELLTIAVPVPARRQGLGRGLLAGFEDEARRRGAGEAFLEVAADNAAALALYAAGGWVEAGRRGGYYGPGLDALILRRDLRQA